VQELQKKKQFISKARSEVREFAAPVVLMKGTKFVKMAGLSTYEEVRDSGNNSLVTLDNMKKCGAFLKSKYTIFFSHEWLSYKVPDPKNSQFEIMVKATKTLAAR